MFVYQKIIRPVLFKIDPEKIHDRAIKIGIFCGKGFLRKNLIGLIYNYKNKKLETEVLGIKFRNPIGLAAGFDKNAEITDIIPYVCFGFEEVGSITGEYCEGNKKPRLWRLPKDKAIAVYYGLKNEGAEIISKRLKNKRFIIPTGINIAKTNDSSIKGEKSVEDYYKAYRLTENIGDYTTINISCPNSGDGRSFEDPELLEALLKIIGKTKRIIFLKISPDLTKSNIDKLIAVCDKYSVSGLVVSNLSKNKENLKSSKEELANVKGGISGEPVKKKSDELIRYIYRKTNGKYVIIGCGGVFTAEDAYKKIKNGASLVQLITGMIYQGPGVIKKINKGLVKLLEKDGYKNIKEAVGKNVIN